ncbi:MAG: M20 family metallopeptidase [Verrucomicrobia bacterium]|nr:M20 family metallopeptidase [Verrucomicrobiota bacterium]
MSRAPASLPALLAEMVALPSVNPGGDPGGSEAGEARYGAWMADHLRGLGAAVEVRALAPGRPNVIGVFEPARPARATVVFAPHLDTVGVAGMTVPPFRLTSRAGRLHGRGACDTKGPTAALLWALRRWTRGGPGRGGSDVRWIVAATAGEEEGSAGAAALVRSGFRADFGVALEPTSLRVVHAAKGILRLWLETPGRACHGAQPWRGDNAVYRALPLAVALRDELAPAFLARRHPVLGPASLNLGVFHGGRDLNIVPDRCRLGLDLRLHPGLGAAEALALVRELCRRHAPRTRVRIHRTGPAFVTPRTDPWARALRRAGAGWARADWFCDANVLAAAGIPSVAFGPGTIARAHTRDEYITRSDLAAGAAAFGRFLAGT